MTRAFRSAVAATVLVSAALLVNGVSPARPTPDGVPTTAAILAAATAPASRPAAEGPKLADVDPAVAALLDRIAARYAATQPLSVAGTLVGTFDVAGRSRTFTLHVTGLTDGQGHYRHDAADTGLLVSDGKTAYLYDAPRDSYARLPADPSRVAAEDVPPSVVAVLLDENPALLLTLTTDPARLLRLASSAALRPATLPTTLHTTAAAPSATTAADAADVVITRDGKTVTLVADPATGTLSRSDIDFTPVLRDRKTNAVRAARVTLTYAPTTQPTTLPAASFTWTPPATATDFTLSDELVRPRATTGPVP